MIPSPRTCGRHLFSLWAERQCRRVLWARQHPRSFRPERGRPPPVRVAGVMCVLHPSQGSQGGSASTTPTHRRWGLASHPFGMCLACSGMFCLALPPRPKPCPHPCGCAESTSRFRAPTWGSFSLRRWGWQPPFASCHSNSPFGRDRVTLRFRVFGGRHRLLLLSVVSRVTLRCSPGYPSHYSAPQVTKPAISPKTLAAANPSFLREKLHPLRSAPTARRFRHSHSHAPPSGAFLPTHSGCFIYIPSFCEATGRKNRLMLATIERRGC